MQPLVLESARPREETMWKGAGVKKQTFFSQRSAAPYIVKRHWIFISEERNRHTKFTKIVSSSGLNWFPWIPQSKVQYFLSRSICSTCFEFNCQWFVTIILIPFDFDECLVDFDIVHQIWKFNYRAVLFINLVAKAVEIKQNQAKSNKINQNQSNKIN